MPLQWVDQAVRRYEDEKVRKGIRPRACSSALLLLHIRERSVPSFLSSFSSVGAQKKKMMGISQPHRTSFRLTLFAVKLFCRAVSFQLPSHSFRDIHKRGAKCEAHEYRAVNNAILVGII